MEAIFQLLKNVWNGETLKIYMFDQGTLDLALDKTGDGTTPLFDNAEIIAGTGNDTVIVETQKFYPMQGNYDFFAYHVDDAAVGVDVVETADVFTLPVTIDGSQDLMVAKAELTADQINILSAEKANDYYSAFSARKGINPHFTFKHLLTRFTFEVKAEGAWTIAADDPSLSAGKNWRQQENPRHVAAKHRRAAP